MRVFSWSSLLHQFLLHFIGTETLSFGGKKLVTEGPISGAPYRREACGGGPEGLPRKILRLRVLWNDFLACEKAHAAADEAISNGLHLNGLIPKTSRIHQVLFAENKISKYVICDPPPSPPHRKLSVQPFTTVKFSAWPLHCCLKYKWHIPISEPTECAGSWRKCGKRKIPMHLFKALSR